MDIEGRGKRHLRSAVEVCYKENKNQLKLQRTFATGTFWDNHRDLTVEQNVGAYSISQNFNPFSSMDMDNIPSWVIPPIPFLNPLPQPGFVSNVYPTPNDVFQRPLSTNQVSRIIPSTVTHKQRTLLDVPIVDETWTNSSTTLPNPVEEIVTNEAFENTIIVKNIPAATNTIRNIAVHFSQFGRIKNIGIGHGGDNTCTLVEFDNKAGALNAFTDPKPVFSDRFISIYYQGKDSDSSPVHQKSEIIPIETIESTIDKSPPKSLFISKYKVIKSEIKTLEVYETQKKAFIDKCKVLEQDITRTLNNSVGEHTKVFLKTLLEKCFLHEKYFSNSQLCSNEESEMAAFNNDENENNFLFSKWECGSASSNEDYDWKRR